MVFGSVWSLCPVIWATPHQSGTIHALDDDEKHICLETGLRASKGVLTVMTFRSTNIRFTPPSQPLQGQPELFGCAMEIPVTPWFKCCGSWVSSR